MNFVIGHCKVCISRCEDCVHCHPLKLQNEHRIKVKELYFKIKSVACKINWLLNRGFICSLKAVRKYLKAYF